MTPSAQGHAKVSFPLSCLPWAVLALSSRATWASWRVAWPDASPEAGSICCSWELDLIGGQKSGSISLIPTTQCCSAQLFFFPCLGCSLPEEGPYYNRSPLVTGWVWGSCYPRGCSRPYRTACSELGPELSTLVLPGSAWAPAALLCRQALGLLVAED